MSTYKIKEAHRPKAPVLIINSYAGSLVIAAQATDHPVVASLEDAGYGLEVQRANFPALTYHADRASWPALDLRGHLVIAHPPCAAFSRQQTVNDKSKTGVDAAKFQETKGVLEYALSQGCDALAVESVCGAYAGAAQIHEAAAKRHGYHLYRVLQNAVTFGVPQWRERFWALFVRQGQLANDELLIDHTPLPRTFGELLEDQPSETDAKLEAMLAEQRQKLQAGGLGGKRATTIWGGKYGFKRFPKPLHEARAAAGLPVLDRKRVIATYWWSGRLESAWVKLIDPAGTAPVLMADSWFVAHGRNLSLVEYKRVMGYPDDYVFPNPRKVREYLSRGVCPPVAAWVLQTLERNLHARQTFYNGRGAHALKDPTFPIKPLTTADLRPKRKLWAAVLADYAREELVG
jgi:site-specific DNA-cytosine methylase